MRIFIVYVLLFVLAVSAPFSGLAQTPVQQDDKIVVTTNEVTLDAVIKDKKGHIVKDLKPDDFEIYEDGIRQQVQSLRLIARQSNASEKTDKPEGTITKSSTDSTSSTTPVNTNRAGAVALVFDRLSSIESRKLAAKAALSYVGDNLSADDFIGVFNIDLSLKTLQTFTNNEQLVRQSIERTTSLVSSPYSSRTDRIADLSQRQASFQNQASTLQAAALTGQGGAGASNAIGENSREQLFNNMTLRAEEVFEQLERDQQGYATTDGLLAITSALSHVPGRKAIIFFSEGVAVSPAVAEHFRSVIGNANRANVSIYTVDAAGLRASSSDSSAGRAMRELGQRRMAQANNPIDPTDGPMMKDLERNEDLLNINPESGLGKLAKETGGILISNTNDPGPRLRQVNDDLNSYYVLTYSPKNQDFDGKFRQINLKVKRSGVEVQARRGYYAINASDDSPLLPYEMPALEILSGKPQSNAFQAHSAAFNFPESNKPGMVPVIVEVPAGAINFAIDRDKKIYNANFSIVVLLKDESQRVVKKLSNQFVQIGPLDKLDLAKNRKTIFYREAELEQGRYTMVSVVYDATAKRSSTNTASIFIPNTDQTKLRLGSIVFIKTAEQLSVINQLKNNPFHFGEVLVYPNLGEPISKSSTKELPVFLTIYPGQGSTAAPKLTLEIMQNNRVINQSSLSLSLAPDETGRIQHAFTIPIDKFQHGTYELKVTVQDTRNTASRSEQFAIAP